MGALKAGCESVAQQVVDAGTPDCFERFRPHRSGRNVFEAVIHNMRRLAAHPALPPTCLVTGRADAIYRDKGDGTKVSYYLFDEYEIHANTLDPGSVQGWHHHNRIIETLYIIAGSIEARWIEDGEVTTRRLDKGDVITVGSSVHTFANPYDRTVEFLVFRLVPDGTDKRGIIKNDRHADDPPPGH